PGSFSPRASPLWRSQARLQRSRAAAVAAEVIRTVAVVIPTAAAAAEELRYLPAVVAVAEVTAMAEGVAAAELRRHSWAAAEVTAAAVGSRKLAPVQAAAVTATAVVSSRPAPLPRRAAVTGTAAGRRANKVRPLPTAMAMVMPLLSSRPGASKASKLNLR